MSLSGSPNIEKMKAENNISGLREVLVNDQNFKSRMDAAEALGEIGGSRAAGALFGGLNDYFIGVRKASAEALAKIGSPAVDTVGKWLINLHIDVQKRAYANDDDRDTDVEVPRMLITMLERIGGLRVVRPLLAALNNEGIEVRGAAARALISVYTSGKLDDEHKQMILNRRADIMAKHTDSVQHGCGVSTPHTDTGIGIDFPL